MAGNLTAMIAAAFSGSAAPPVTSDPYFEYTTLLLPGNGTNGAQNNTFLDGSTNNFTITRNGNTTQGTFSPFSQTGWGNYFNGSSGNLTVPYNSDFDYGSGDFTIEFWMYPTATGDRGILIQSNNYSTYGPIWIRYTSGTINIFATTANSAWNLFNNTVITGTIPLNTWTHIAITRTSAGVWTSYVNGTSAWTATAAGSLYVNSNSTNIGTVTSDTSFVFSGYLSNLRIVKGIVVYTGNFTPPTSALTSTQSSGTNIAAITGTETSLLTCQSNRFIDNSSNTFTVTPNGSPTVVAFSPFNPTASWSAATNGGSGYFDGSGDYLSVAYNSNLQLGSSDFTIEFWFYGTVAQNNADVFLSGYTSGTNLNYLIAVPSGNDLKFYASTTGTPWTLNALTIGTLITGQWNHIAITRSGSTVTTYLNGTVGGTSTALGSSAIYANTAPVYIGTAGDGLTTYNVTGYFSGFRIVKGTAITPPSGGPTSPPTDVTNTQLLLNFTNAGIYDATSKNDLETVGNAQISTAQYKFPPSSMAFDGTTDYLNISPERFSSFGTGSFTVEFWMKTSGSTFNIINPATATGTGYWALLVQTGAGGFRWNDAYNVSNLWTQTATSVLDNNWHHIAIVRNGTGSGNVNIYFDGVAQGTAKTDSTNYNGALTAWRVGSGNAGDFNGYLQDLRITPGIARYTSNFTAPTAAFPTL